MPQGLLQRSEKWGVLPSGHPLDLCPLVDGPSPPTLVAPPDRSHADTRRGERGRSRGCALTFFTPWRSRYSSTASMTISALVLRNSHFASSRRSTSSGGNVNPTFRCPGVPFGIHTSTRGTLVTGE